MQRVCPSCLLYYTSLFCSCLLFFCIGRNAKRKTFRCSLCCIQIFVQFFVLRNFLVCSFRSCLLVLKRNKIKSSDETKAKEERKRLSIKKYNKTIYVKIYNIPKRKMKMFLFKVIQWHLCSLAGGVFWNRFLKQRSSDFSTSKKLALYTSQSHITLIFYFS